MVGRTALQKATGIEALHVWVAAGQSGNSGR